MNKDHELGKLGEDVVANYISRLGYKIIERNFKCNQGEIDIIALDKKELIFIEVKTRTSMYYGEAGAAVNIFKKRHLINSIKYYLYKRNLENELIRIDVAEVYIKKDKIKINYIKKAVV